MTTGVAKHQIISWLLKTRKHCRQGFTLIELLVSILIGSIIISALLFLVTELNRLNGREELLTQTQQNMRRAIDYIESDLSEAVFVYADPPPAVLAQLDDLPPTAEATPILAFWRIDPIDPDYMKDLDCSTFEEDSPGEAECTTLQVRHSAYTLVVYLQSVNNADSEIWEGRTRIIRYQLPKYASGATAIRDLTQRNGYQDPSLEDSGFDAWEKAPDETTDGDIQVLTDYVDLASEPAAPSDCPTGFTASGTNSFYVCARSGEADADVAGFEGLNSRTNQSVILYLTGNASRSDGDVLTNASSDASRLPTLESEVLIRGVIGKAK